MKLKLAYFGTPEFAADLLKKILHDSELPVKVDLIVTQADKKVGRKQILTATPVKILGHEYKINVFDGSLKEAYIKDKLRSIDIAVVYAYGKLIPDDILSIPRLGFWNIHPSLLPKYRGPSPIAYPLLMNDKETGVSLMLMDKEMDHGNILKQELYEIGSETRRLQLENDLTNLAYTILKDSLVDIFENKRVSKAAITSIAQNHVSATYTRKLSKEDGFIQFEVLQKILNQKETDWKPQILNDYINKNSNILDETTHFVQDSSLMVFNLFRSLYPWPGIWTKIIVNGKQLRLKLTDVKISQNILHIEKVQLEGKNEVEFKVFNKAYKIFDIHEY